MLHLQDIAVSARVEAFKKFIDAVGL